MAELEESAAAAAATHGGKDEAADVAGSFEQALSGTDIAKNFCQHVLTPEFFEKHWERYPLHHRGSVKGPAGNLLPSVITVDDVVSIIRRAGPSLKMFRHGEPYDTDNFMIAYLDGASMIVNQADRHNPALFQLSRALADLHFLHVFGVIYLTPPNSQAVRLHNDDQDVFLMQVWGRKRWTIREAPQLLPYTEEMLGKEQPVPKELEGKAIMEFTMEPHDVLYIPRGFLHEAATGNDESSLHVTITIPTSDYCWGVQVLKHMVSNLSTQDLPKRIAPAVGVPSGVGPQVPDDEELDALLKEKVGSWLSNLSVDGLLDAFDKRMARTNEGQNKTFEKSMNFRLRPFVAEVSRVRLMHGVTCMCEHGGDVAIFLRTADRQRLELPIAPSASELVRSLTSKPQRVADLPCRDAFQRVCVLQLLNQQGVVQLFLADADENTIMP